MSKMALEGGIYIIQKILRKTSYAAFDRCGCRSWRKDDGAMSASGIKEKDINLKISKHVKNPSCSRYKYRVVMTRKDDTFIPL
ncbi:MAG: hypothetical protein CM1200mP16_04950 [Nitrospina sp.]|nr:MAG: hypothetical protein CM1200mP16_04950 [Nitrospina sp.]